MPVMDLTNLSMHQFSEKHADSKQLSSDQIESLDPFEYDTLINELGLTLQFTIPFVFLNTLLPPLQYISLYIFLRCSVCFGYQQESLRILSSSLFLSTPWIHPILLQ